MNVAATAIHIEGLSKRYGAGETAVLALKEVNMQLAPGEVVGLIAMVSRRTLAYSQTIEAGMRILSARAGA